MGKGGWGGREGGREGGGRGGEGRADIARRETGRQEEMVAERDLERYSQGDMVGQREGWRRKGL